MKIEIHPSDEMGTVLRTLKNTVIRFREKTFCIRKGFESDGVSTPRFLWASVSPAIDPRSIRGGVAHDYIYRVQPMGWTRGEADLMFFIFLVEDGLGIWNALKAYVGVRLFGWIPWRNNRENKEE